MKVKYYIMAVLVLLISSSVMAQTNQEGYFKEAEKYTVRIYGSTVTALETSIRGSWTGSGFVLHIDRNTGYAFVGTNKHVIGDGISSLQISFKDGERFQALPVYIDPIYDFGILKFKLSEKGVSPGITCAVMGDSEKASVGISVGTFGNPMGLEYCATKGIISSTTNTPGEFAGSFLQTDAAINPGNSGGPLISLEDGLVIGVNTAVTNDTQGIGWSLAINQLKPIIDQVIKGELPYAGRMGWIGATIEEINTDRAIEDFGAKFASLIPRKSILVTAVLKESPAEKSGFMPGDIIMSVDNKLPMDNADFLSTMRNLGGKKCSFLLCRMGQQINLDLDVLERGSLRPKEYVTFAGMVIQPNSPTVYETSYSWASPDCVYVSDVLEGSSGEAWGAHKGTIRGMLINMTYYQVKSLTDFWNAIKDVKPGQPVEFFYWTTNYGTIVKVVYYSESEMPSLKKVNI